jgi:predicted negative regulator of RcsB-dependent stress response
MSSEKQLILIIITFIVVMGWQLWKDKKKNDYWKKYRRSKGWD